MKRAQVVLFAFAGFAAFVACDPVQGISPVRAPKNTCPEFPCEAYRRGATRATCLDAKQRCEFSGQPDYVYTVVVSVPTTSFYAAGHTFVVTKKELFESPPLTRLKCPPPKCLALPRLAQASGGYLTTQVASTAVGFPVPDKTALPVRVAFFPLVAGATADGDARDQGLPLDVTWAASRRFVATSNEPSDRLLYLEAIPSGKYRRVSFPQAPYDEYFPPVETVVDVGTEFTDNFTLGDTAPLDDETGEARLARVTRAEGLEGWTAWLADGPTGRRVSSLRKLNGTDIEVRLDTSGQRADPGAKALRDGVEAVVAPPAGWIAVPRLQSVLLGGQGLQNLAYPALPPPASITGLVGAETTPGRFAAIPSRVLFRSTRIRTQDGTDSPLLRYGTELSTDASGGFATVLPPGVYEVSVEPAEGTAFAKFTKTYELTRATALTLTPPPRTLGTGRVLLGDGRPLAEGEVLAIASRRVGAAPGRPPRPARAKTDLEGNFQFFLDHGEYVFTVVPQAQTGFPRIASVRTIGLADEDLGTLEVPVPMILPLEIKGPRINDDGIDNPIKGAVVRVFATPAEGVPAIELANAMTDDAGKCEILLPRSL